MSDIEKLEKQKDGAYWERNQLVASLSKVFPAHLAKHPEEDTEWDEDWRTIVVIKLPLALCATESVRGYECRHTFGDEYQSMGMKDTVGLREKVEGEEYYQLSWHIHDSEIPMFDHLVYQEFMWDGHTNEDKYRRLRLLTNQPDKWGNEKV